jgi:MoaA/NifB/PqqE/SkfB family radical SAM enzyme
MHYEYFLDIVGTCNLRCPSCPTGNFSNNEFINLKKPKGFMPMNLFQKIIDKIALFQNPKSTNLYLYNWGEPLLHPNIEEILNIASEKHFKIFISSNLNVNTDFKNILKYNINQFRISTSGFFDKTYTKTHLKGNVHLVKSNMYRIKYLIDKYNLDLNIEVCYHLYKHNLKEDYSSMKELCNELNFSFKPIVAGFVNVEKLIKYKANNLSRNDSTFIEDLIIDLTTEEQSTETKIQCNLYDNQIVINFDGSVALCCGVYDPYYTLKSKFIDIEWKNINNEKTIFSETCGKCIKIGINNYLMGKNDNAVKEKLKKELSADL